MRYSTNHCDPISVQFSSISCSSVWVREWMARDCLRYCRQQQAVTGPWHQLLIVTNRKCMMEQLHFLLFAFLVRCHTELYFHKQWHSSWISCNFMTVFLERIKTRTKIGRIQYRVVITLGIISSECMNQVSGKDMQGKVTLTTGCGRVHYADAHIITVWVIVLWCNWEFMMTHKLLK